MAQNRFIDTYAPSGFDPATLVPFSRDFQDFIDPTGSRRAQSSRAPSWYTSEEAFYDLSMMKQVPDRSIDVSSPQGGGGFPQGSPQGGAFGAQASATDPMD